MNRLKNESSPYLLQHAGNPVHWYPWGSEALLAARESDRPILLSIGYSACHWCHVMEKESFEDHDTADIMNRHFINIKVDREERPDLDSIYMQAVQAITGRGGWPMTVFLLPDGRPFFGGTYFPPRPLHGLPSFAQVLDSVSSAYRNRRKDVDAAAENIGHTLKADIFGTLKDSEQDGMNILHTAWDILNRNMDSVYGGMKGAPKFPSPGIYEFMLRYSIISGKREPLDAAIGTLVKMSSGGIYDQVGGGFHRYSVDEKWLVPHFEKMLYDNAQLSRLYLHAWQMTGNEVFKDVAVEIYEYVVREMASPDGGFYSSTDADTDGEEGRFFVWDREELRGILGDDFSLASFYWGIGDEPNFEGGNILNIPHDEKSAAEKFNLTEKDLRERIRMIKKILYDQRGKRTRPGLDDKIITSWSGMMTASLAEASRILGRKDYLAAAVKSGNFIIDKLGSGQAGIFHIYKDGTAKINGFLDDYGSVIDAFIELYQATFDGKWVDHAFRYAGYVIENFSSGDGLFFDTGSGHEELFMRPKNIQDNAVPSGNSMMARQLLRLWCYSGDSRFAEAAGAVLNKLMPVMFRYPMMSGEALNALCLSAGGITGAAVVGDSDSPATGEMLNVLNSVFRPGMVIAYSPDDAGSDNPVPLLRGRVKQGGRTAVYICRDQACSMPVTEPDEVRKLLEKNP